MSKNRKKPAKSSSTPDEKSKLDELELLRLKVLAYETMIEIAEKELGITIKKKSGEGESEATAS